MINLNGGSSQSVGLPDDEGKDRSEALAWQWLNPNRL
jgi:hypothetical protein